MHRTLINELDRANAAAHRLSKRISRSIARAEDRKRALASQRQRHKLI
jgi:hypothetical protein